MQTERILGRSQGTPENSETLSFRLTKKDKRDLLEICEERGLSVGRLMRALVKEFINEV